MPKKKSKKKLKKAGTPKPPARPKSVKKKSTTKKKAPKKKSISKKVPAKRLTKTKGTPKKKKSVRTKSVATHRGSAAKKRGKQQDLELETDILDRRQLRSRSAGQSGDLQGLSGVESADSESVDELLEEGNAFEAEVVSGVEDAGDSDEKEVRTHEVSEDDVPEEYLDEE